MKLKLLYLLIMTSCCLVLSTNKSEATDNSGTFQKSIKRKDKTLLWIESDYGEYLADITSRRVNVDGSALLSNKLYMYKMKNNKLNKVFEYDAGLDHVYCMYPIGANSLMTLWISGSGYHIKLFTINSTDISLSIDSGSSVVPEILDIDNDGLAEIFISDGAFVVDATTNKVISKPTASHIYKWNGKKYLLTKTVPWETRFWNNP